MFEKFFLRYPGIKDEASSGGFKKSGLQYSLSHGSPSIHYDKDGTRR